MTYPTPRSQAAQERPSSPAAKRRVPAAVKWAAGWMLGGGALTVIWGALEAMQWDRHPSIGHGPGTGILLGAAGCLPWLWMALAALAGDWGARVLSVVFFDVYFLFAIPGLISGSASPDIVLGVSLELAIGLAAIILLWRPASSQFFSAARQARTATRS